MNKFAIGAVALVLSGLALGGGFMAKEGTERDQARFTQTATAAYTSVEQDSENVCTTSVDGDGNMKTDCRIEYTCYYTYSYSPNNDGEVTDAGRDSGNSMSCRHRYSEGKVFTVWYDASERSAHITHDPNGAIMATPVVLWIFSGLLGAASLGFLVAGIAGATRGRS